MDEVSACRDLEHVDIAAELQMLRALFPCSLNLFLALWRPHVQLLDGLERRTLWGSNDHVWTALSDLRECPLATFVRAEIPDVAVRVGSGIIEGEPTSRVHAIRFLHHSRRSIDLCEVVLALEAGLHRFHGLSALLYAEALAHCPCIFIRLFSMTG